MKEKDGMKISRRDFLAGVALAGAAGTSAGCDKKPQPESRPEERAGPQSNKIDSNVRSRVVLVRDKRVLDEAGNINPQVLVRMLDDGVQALFGDPQPEIAWARMIRPTDTVGIKSNVWRFIPSPPELEEAIRQRVIKAGVDAQRIAIDDRGVLKNPGFTKATALINVRTLRTHHWSGIGSCIKNYIMFHPQPDVWHTDSCANLAGLWDMPIVKGKTRLNIQVALTPLFHGKGPHHYQASYTWPYKGLLLGEDPVAVDATAVRLLEAKRLEFFGKEQPFSVEPKHVRIAEEKFGLGVADRARIDLHKIGFEDGSLI